MQIILTQDAFRLGRIKVLIVFKIQVHMIGYLMVRYAIIGIPLRVRARIVTTVFAGAPIVMMRERIQFIWQIEEDCMQYVP